MTIDPHAEMPHEPAPPEPRWRMPDSDSLLRGAGLAGLATAAGWLAVASLRTSWVLAPVAAGLGIVSFLAGWASAIHLTGGEKFDDHPFI